VSAALAAAWAVTMLLWWRSRRLQPDDDGAADADFDYQVEEKAAWDAVVAANKGNDLRQLRSALLTLGTVWFPQRRYAGLGALAAADSDISRQLAVLDQQLYSQNPSQERFNAGTLMDALRRLRPAHAQRNRPAGDLPPLYPV
jgi:hypothetical protein